MSNDNTELKPSHFIANRRSPSGYTYTLPSRLGDILSELESNYGARDRSWTILGVEFGPDDHPRVWYPGDCGQIIIQLSKRALNDTVMACYQLAEESIHLLAPDGGESKGKVIEEGAGEVFSVDYCKREFGIDFSSRSGAYGDAEKKVRQLLSIYPDAIRALRHVDPSFNQMTPETFAAAGLDVPRELIDGLLAPFVRG